MTQGLNVCALSPYSGLKQTITDLITDLESQIRAVLNLILLHLIKSSKLLFMAFARY